MGSQNTPKWPLAERNDDMFFFHCSDYQSNTKISVQDDEKILKKMSPKIDQNGPKQRNK